MIATQIQGCQDRDLARLGGDSKIVKHKIGRSYPIIFVRSEGGSKIVKHKIIAKIVRYY